MVSGEGSQDQVAPRGVEPRLPNPERRPQGNKNRQIDRKWRPDEHRRPVGLTPVSARARRNARKMLVESSLSDRFGPYPPEDTTTTCRPRSESHTLFSQQFSCNSKPPLTGREYCLYWLSGRTREAAVES